MWNLVSVHMETVLVSVQYRCTICAERTIGSEIILDTPGDTPRQGWTKSLLSWLGGSVQKYLDWTHLSFKIKMT
jgi:hypothetical protein